MSDMKTLLEAVSKNESVLNETVLDEGLRDLDHASMLEEIAMQIEELVEDARNIVHEAAREQGDHVMLKRADSYWIAHILGAVGLGESRGSMQTMMETVREIKEGEEEVGDLTDAPYNDYDADYEDTLR